MSDYIIDQLDYVGACKVHSSFGFFPQNSNDFFCSNAIAF